MKFCFLFSLSKSSVYSNWWGIEWPGEERMTPDWVGRNLILGNSLMRPPSVKGEPWCLKYQWHPAWHQKLAQPPSLLPSVRCHSCGTCCGTLEALHLVQPNQSCSSRSAFASVAEGGQPAVLFMWLDLIPKPCAADHFRSKVSTILLPCGSFSLAWKRFLISRCTIAWFSSPLPGY